MVQALFRFEFKIQFRFRFEFRIRIKNRFKSRFRFSILLRLRLRLDWSKEESASHPLPNEFIRMPPVLASSYQELANVLRLASSLSVIGLLAACSSAWCSTSAFAAVFCKFPSILFRLLALPTMPGELYVSVAKKLSRN